MYVGDRDEGNGYSQGRWLALLHPETFQPLSAQVESLAALSLGYFAMSLD